MQEKDKEASAWELLRPVVLRFVGPDKGLVILAIIAGALAAAAAGFGLPFMLQSVFPVVFDPSKAPEWFEAWVLSNIEPESQESCILWGAALLLPLIMLVRGLASFFNSYLLTKAGLRILTRLRTAVFARLQSLSFSFHDRRKRGEMMTSVIQYTQSLQQTMIYVLNDLVIQPLTLIAALGFLIYAALTSEQSAILLANLIVVAGCIPLVRFVGRRVLKQMEGALLGMGFIATAVEESLAAQREVRAFNLQERQEKALAQSVSLYNRILIRIVAWHQGISPAIEIVSALALSFALYRGCSDGLTLEQFIAIATAFYYCYDPIKRLGGVSAQCQMMRAIVAGINEILHADDETPEPQTPQRLADKPAGQVDFKGVHFGYLADVPVLKNINVSVPSGQVVALVGPSGSGKTSFINLICRFYDVNAGCVAIDGVDVRQLSRAERTKHIGLVSQFSALFRTSIRENIRLGRPDASDAEVEAAGELARVSEFAYTHPEGYERMLSEGGSGLSGGQRQRVSIARAFLKNASILILDEATSALDMKSESLIQAELEKLALGHTTFIIAHRFSTIRMAQRILVFNEGEIIADGSHAELYESSPLYRRLYDEQVRSAEQESAQSLDEETLPC